MTSSSDFRTNEEEVAKLLEELSELKLTLKRIGSQIVRMEVRVKHAFPIVAKKINDRQIAHQQTAQKSITPEGALAKFDMVVQIASSGRPDEAEKMLMEISSNDLFMIAKEIGISFPRNKPSQREVREAIFGKVREGVLLTHHIRRT